MTAPTPPGTPTGPSAAESPGDHGWLDRLPLPAAIVRDWRIVYINDAALRLLAYTREQALSMVFEDAIAPEDVERVRERYALRLRGERVPSSYELNMIRGDGQRRTVEIFVTASAEGNLFQLYDVTGRVTRHEHLRALARLGAAVQRELSDEAIFGAVTAGLTGLGAVMFRLVPVGEQVQVIEVSAAPLEFLKGLSRPMTPSLKRAWEEGFAFYDDLGQAASRFMDEARAAHLRQVLAERGLTHGVAVRLEARGAPAELMLLAAAWLRPEDQPTLTLFGAQISAALDAARTVRDLSQRNAELTALNHVATVAGHGRELTELFTEAAREVVRVTGCVAVALYLVDETWATLASQFGGSEEAGRLFAKVPLATTRLGEVVKSRAPRVWRRTDYDEVRQQVLRRMQQEVVISVPMVARSRVVGVMNAAHAVDKEISPQEIELLSAMAAHLAAAVETARLVEDLRRRADQLSQTQAQLVQRERLAALGEMAAAVAHEVRNPLAVIFNLLAALRRAPAQGANGAELLAMLTEESERIDHLVNDLLDLARPSLPALADVSLPLLVQDAVGAVVNAEPEVQLEVKNEAGLGDVQVDPRLMRQVFVNLAINAVQAMANGGTLSVVLEQVERGGVQRVRVTFADTGHGIAEAVMPRIFEPFFTTRARGTGLGLTLVKRIMEAHKGEVSAASGPDGAALSVEWPLHS